MPRVEDETLYEIAGKGGFVDCLLDLPSDDMDEQAAYIEQILARYYRTVVYRLTRELDCKREKNE